MGDGGKGSVQRPTDKAQFEKNYETIFGPSVVRCGRCKFFVQEWKMMGACIVDKQEHTPVNRKDPGCDTWTPITIPSSLPGLQP